MKTTTITLRISEIEKEKIVQEAKKRDIAASQLIREAVKAFLEEKQPVEDVNHSKPITSQEKGSKWEVGESRYLNCETDNPQKVMEQVYEYMSQFRIPEIWAWEWEMKQVSPNRYIAIITKEK